MDPERWHQIEELYHRACEHGMEALAGADPEVRRKVEELLAQDSSSAFFDRPAAEYLDATTGTLSSPSNLAGQTVSHYKILEQVGAGGMGVVFRAHDTKLNRPVAVKILAQEFADMAARRRFQREAQTASSLNHPHILTVYDTGEVDGRQYLVTEFVDGGTLKDWIQKAPRDCETITELLTGVADALATAHEAGILHRDIKPENILITSSGYAKLADFGLAKLEDRSASATRTITEAQTQKGLVIGTIAYMSPEQAAGQALDARSDLFSFGVVLYEMLARRRPFQGATNLELLQQVIHGEPAPLVGKIPAPLCALVMKALEKDPADRYASMRELVTALRSARHTSGDNIASRLTRPRKWLAGVAAAALVGAVTIGAVLYRSREVPTSQRLEYIPLTNFIDSATAPTLSPDGRMLAFIRGASTFSGIGEVYVKLLPDGDPVQLTHDGRAKMGPPGFSPDGARIAYTVGTWETWSVPVLGGEPTRLLAKTEGLSWTNTNPPRVMYSANTGEGIHMGIFASTESRSQSRTVYLPASIDGMAHRSFLSRDGKSVIIVEMDVGQWLPCRLVPFDGSSAGHQVGPAGECTFAGWTPDGEWMYFSVNSGDGFHIWRQRFPDGKPEQVTSGATEENGVSFAPDGKSFVTSVGETQSALWIHDLKGERQITFEGYAYLPSFSKDGTRLYYLQRSKSNRRFVSGELWTEDLPTGKKQRLLPDFEMQNYDVSADGKQVVFVNGDVTGRATLWIGMTDGSAPPQQLVNQGCMVARFAPDGEIYFTGGEQASSYLQAVKPDGTGLRKVTQERVLFLYDISPDVKWAAAWSQDKTAIKLYPTAGGEPIQLCVQCAGAGAEERGLTPPIVSWSQDGKEMYLYSERSLATYVVPLKPGQDAPAAPLSETAWINQPPSIPGMRTIPHQRAFMSGDASLYAYTQVSAHRNIYRIRVP